MAWVRIHDGALTHPKLVGLFNPRDPFHLWVWGLSYAQMHLTDGFIPRAAVPRGSGKAEQSLIHGGLWETAEGGVRIHDYVDWNNSKDYVTSQRAAARERMASVRANTPKRTATEQALEDESKSSSANVLLGLGTVSSSPEPVKKEPRPPSANGRGRHPIFAGQRIVVFDWMFEDLRQILGPYLDDFAIDEWFCALDAKAMRSNLVIPKRDNGAWLQAQLLEECARRGLKIAGAKEDPYEKFPTAWQCKQCGEIHEGTQEQGRRGVCQKSAVGGRH